jgi:hypothetical protein
MFRAWLILLSIVCAGGCGGRDPLQPVPVQGTVFWKGVPMSVGRVQFIPDNPNQGRPATGDIDKFGNYTLSTFQPEDGAIPGSYKVQVFPFDYNAEVTAKTYKQVPERYQDPETSGLTAVVDSRPKLQKFDFDLVD